jgi:predicted RNase H-like HicB family nuclease
MVLKIILSPAEEGGFTATIDGMKGVISEGDTQREALENVIDAFHTHLQWQVEKQDFQEKSTEHREFVLV